MIFVIKISPDWIVNHDASGINESLLFDNACDFKRLQEVRHELLLKDSFTTRSKISGWNIEPNIKVNYQ